MLGFVCAAGCGATGNAATARRALCGRASARRGGRAAVRMAGEVEAAWTQFAAKMKEADESPPVDAWNELLQVAADANDFERGAWIMNTMRDTGRRPSAGSYEIMLESCIRTQNNKGAFFLVEQMYNDKVPFGDVSLPDGMEDTLRAILPPDAFN
uniref:Pentacotripeptide-repeat region of PRORP domain-containing protein n=1 Tax=Erythrolobus australicus TaxID=1077150 RepID=A0A7S1XGS3_9RHOD